MIFKNFRRRPTHDYSDVSLLQKTVADLVELLELHPDLRNAVQDADRQRLHTLLPVATAKSDIHNEFEYDLACVVAQEMRAKLVKSYGFLESRWPNMETHVMAYRELVDMLERCVERNPEYADANATVS